MKETSLKEKNKNDSRFQENGCAHDNVISKEWRRAARAAGRSIVPQREIEVQLQLPRSFCSNIVFCSCVCVCVCTIKSIYKSEASLLSFGET